MIRFSDAERLAALRVGANVACERVGTALAGHRQTLQVSVRLAMGGNARPVKARAVWRWPGVLRVTVRDTGQLIAQSLPGRPFEMDSAAITSEATQ